MPRYVFSNVSTDITQHLLLRVRLPRPAVDRFLPKRVAAVSIYVSRKADVARLDEFVGPKR